MIFSELGFDEGYTTVSRTGRVRRFQRYKHTLAAHDIYADGVLSWHTRRRRTLVVIPLPKHLAQGRANNAAIRQHIEAWRAKHGGNVS